MAQTERGRIHDNGIVFSKPLSFPEGTEVDVSIKIVNQDKPVSIISQEISMADLPLFGMWANREDMSDSVEWVQQKRNEWNQRLSK